MSDSNWMMGIMNRLSGVIATLVVFVVLWAFISSHII